MSALPTRSARSGDAVTASRDWGQFTLRWLEHLGAALVVLVGGFLVAIAARALVRRWLRRHGEALGPSVSRLVYGSVYYGLLLLTAAVSLIVLGVPQAIVAAAFVVILIVLGIALHESVADLAATVIFLIFRPFKRGELIETLGQLGKVHEILMFNTVLLLPDQRLVTLANSRIHEEGIVNYTRMGRIRVDFSFTVPHHQDIDQIRALVAEILDQDPRVLDTPPPEIGAEELTELGVRIGVGPSVTPTDYWDISGDLLERIKTRFPRRHPLRSPPARLDAITRGRRA